MIVAIAPAGTGQVAVEEFRVAADTATAVSDFCNEYSPPLNTTDYVGHDTGWSAHQKPAAPNRWSYDHDTPGLVETALPVETRFRASTKLVGSTPFIITAVDSWETVDTVVTSVDYFIADLTKALARVIGACKIDGVGAKLRVVERGSPDTVISAEFALPDTSSAWDASVLAFNTNAVPSAGQNEYALEAQLGVTGTQATSAEIRSVSQSLLELT